MFCQSSNGFGAISTFVIGEVTFGPSSGVDGDWRVGKGT